MTSMSLAAVFWLGLHFIVAGPLRSTLVDKLGERYFFGIFSLLSVAGRRVKPCNRFTLST
jgi:uncharacterized membrane protein